MIDKDKLKHQQKLIIKLYKRFLFLFIKFVKT